MALPRRRRSSPSPRLSTAGLQYSLPSIEGDGAEVGGKAAAKLAHRTVFQAALHWRSRDYKPKTRNSQRQNPGVKRSRASPVDLATVAAEVEADDVRGSSATGTNQKWAARIGSVEMKSAPHAPVPDLCVMVLRHGSFACGRGEARDERGSQMWDRLSLRQSSSAQQQGIPSAVSGAGRALRSYRYRRQSSECGSPTIKVLTVLSPAFEIRRSVRRWSVADRSVVRPAADGGVSAASPVRRYIAGSFRRSNAKRSQLNIVVAGCALMHVRAIVRSMPAIAVDREVVASGKSRR